MFKKILLLIIVLSPLWYSLFIGYPIISDKEHQLKQKQRPTISISKRCFAVGDFKEFSNCFAHSEKIKGNAFIQEVSEKITTISPVITVLFILTLGVFIIASALLIIS